MIWDIWFVLVSEMLKFPYQTAAQDALHASIGQCGKDGRVEICASQAQELVKLMAFVCWESSGLSRTPRYMEYLTFSKIMEGVLFISTCMSRYSNCAAYVAHHCSSAYLMAIQCCSAMNWCRQPLLYWLRSSSWIPRCPTSVAEGSVNLSASGA